MLTINNIHLNAKSIISIQYQQELIGWIWNTPRKFIITTQAAYGSFIGTSVFWYGSSQQVVHEVLATDEDSFKNVEEFLNKSGAEYNKIIV